MVECQFIQMDSAGVIAEAVGSPSSSQPVFLDKAQVDQLLRKVNAASATGEAVITAPSLLVYSGQRAYVLTANQRAYVAGITVSAAPAAPSTTSSAPIAGATYTPDVQVVESGMVLDVRATVTDDGNSAIVTLRPQLSELESIATRPFAGAPPSLQLSVQDPLVRKSALTTTLETPSGNTAVVRGLRLPGEAGSELLMLVKATVVKRQSATAPAGSSPPASQSSATTKKQ